MDCIGMMEMDVLSGLRRLRGEEKVSIDHGRLVGTPSGYRTFLREHISRTDYCLAIN